MEKAGETVREWMSLPQVAAYLGVDIKEVRQWVHFKVDPLPAYLPPSNKKQVKVNRQDVDKWVRDTWRTLQ